MRVWHIYVQQVSGHYPAAIVSELGKLLAATSPTPPQPEPAAAAVAEQFFRILQNIAVLLILRGVVKAKILLAALITEPKSMKKTFLVKAQNLAVLLILRVLVKAKILLAALITEPKSMKKTFGDETLPET